MRLRLNGLNEGYQTIVETIGAVDLGVENPPFANAIEVSLTIDKEPKEIKIAGQVATLAVFECDRCLAHFTQQLVGDFNLLVTEDIPKAKTEIYEDLISITPTTSEIDLTAYIYDTLLLSVPMKKLCKPECQGLCPVCGANLNEGSCQCSHRSGDERWEILKRLSTTMTEEK